VGHLRELEYVKKVLTRAVGLAGGGCRRVTMEPAGYPHLPSPLKNEFWSHHQVRSLFSCSSPLLWLSDPFEPPSVQNAYLAMVSVHHDRTVVDIADWPGPSEPVRR